MIASLKARGKQAAVMLASLPQSTGRIVVGGDAPADSLTLIRLDDGKSQLLSALYAQDQKAGKATLLNFGSIT